MKEKIEVYDTISKKNVEIEVDEEFAREYRRMIWKNEKQDQSFYNHNVQVSMFNNCEDNAFENYCEFITNDEYNKADNAAIRNAYIKKLKEAIEKFPEKDKKIIDLLFMQNLSERECAKQCNCTQVNIHKKKQRILCILDKLLKT